MEKEKIIEKVFEEYYQKGKYRLGFTSVEVMCKDLMLKALSHNCLITVSFDDFVKELKEKLESYNLPINNHIKFIPKLANEEIDKLSIEFKKELESKK